MHEGHRKRMYEKLRTDSSICDHEVLEMLLFNVIPRKNTNPLAHKLISEFGSLSGVFEAGVDQLLSVNGVGENVAYFIKNVYECNRRVKLNSSGVAVLKTFEDFKRFVVVRLRGQLQEVLEIYCLEKNGKVKRVSSFTSNECNRVKVDCNNIANIIARENPYGIVCAHNHLSGGSEPSESDNRFTVELQVMCSMSNVVLFDHIIYASDTNVFSYFESGNIEDIRRNFTFKGIIDDKIKSRAEKNKK